MLLLLLLLLLLLPLLLMLRHPSPHRNSPTIRADRRRSTVGRQFHSRYGPHQNE